MPFWNKQTDKIYEAIDAGYDLVLGFNPPQVTRVKFDHGEARFVKLLGCNFATLSATAIYGDGIFLVKLGCGALYKIFVFNINI